MKTLQHRRKVLLVSLFVLLTALIAGPVWAGGWAEITMDELPGEIHAGDSVRMSFMVHQHGVTPVHYLEDWDEAVVPVISGTNVETGESVEFTAVVDESEVGRFYADVVFPAAGEWSWTVAPNPLMGATEFAPLTILPELNTLTVETGATAETAAAAAGTTGGVAWTAGLLLVGTIGLMGFMIFRRKREMAVAVSSGD